MTIHYFIGIDVSKATAPADRLDWAVFDGKGIVLQSQSVNTQTGIKATLKLIRALPGFTIAESVCCLEHTTRWPPAFTMHIHLSFFINKALLCG
jgi:hypothetical protein